jgi:hypothetical protein
MNKIEIKVIFDKAEVLYIKVLGRFFAENNLIKKL